MEITGSPFPGDAAGVRPHSARSHSTRNGSNLSSFKKEGGLPGQMPWVSFLPAKRMH